MATSAFGLTEATFMNSQLASCLANGLGSLCGPAHHSLPVQVPVPVPVAGSSASGTSSPSSGSLDSMGGMEPEQPVAPTCGSCDEGGIGVASCTACKETLCDACAQAHQRVRLTKDHRLVRLEVGVTCSPGLAAPDNRNVNYAFLTECDAGSKHLKDQLDDGQKLVDTIEMKALQIGGEIRLLCRAFIAAVEERERELLGRLDKVRVLKRKTLLLQMEAVRGLLVRFSRLSDSLREALQRGSSLDLLHMKEKAAVELLQLRAARANIMPGPGRMHDDDILGFVGPDPGLLRAVATMGSVTSSGFALATVAIGEGIAQADQGKRCKFTVQMKNHLNEPLVNSLEPLDAVLIGPDGVVVRCSIEDRRDGSHEVTYCPLTAGVHGLHVTLRGRHILGSPFQVTVAPSPTPDYSLVRHATLTFGCEGGNDGEFLRPWGICSDSQGRLIVADRSNNRIQIFTEEGKFIKKFGIHGSQPGEFDRPAGVTCNSNDDIIVADKDNHRVQIFSSEGNFILKFGEFGCKSGQFNYPWDVATNANNEIVVSDTRNHRIQLFSSDGLFLKKYGFESYVPMWKHFDSPRGIAFTKCGYICVTDFNNHRLLVVDPELRGARFLGVEGSGQKQFQRPQGVAVNADDKILVADSRNNRIQVFEATGVFSCEIGLPLIEMDRPSGLCVTKSGKIAVIDFGNSRVVLI